MTEEHTNFLQDCYNMKLYLTYVRTKVKHAQAFDEEELQKYHASYVKLVSNYEGFSGSQFRIDIKTIMDSVKSQDEKYACYKNQINVSIDAYNKVYALHPHKQIKL